MDDTSLDDFLASESEDGGDHSDTADSDGEAVGDGESGESPEPATTTSRWDSDGVACAVCDASVERVWESDAGLVCSTCKEW